MGCVTSSPPKMISYELLSKQDAETSAALVDLYASSEEFTLLSAREGEGILARDKDRIYTNIQFRELNRHTEHKDSPRI